MAKLIGGSGFDYVQNTTPSGADFGESWLDTSTDPPQQKVYADLGSGGQWTVTGSTDEVAGISEELKSGRTRELLLLLQGDPIPEVVDPLNIQALLSSNYSTDDDGDYILDSTSTNGFVTDKFTASATELTEFKQWSIIRAEDVTTGGSTSANPVEFDFLTVNSRPREDRFTGETNKYGIKFEPNENVSEVEAVIHDSSNPPTQAYLKDDDTGTLIKSKSIEGTSVRFTGVDLTAGNIYRLVANSNGNSYTRTSNGDSLPQKGDVFDFVSGIFNDSGTDSGTTYVFKSLVSTKNSLSIPKAEIVDEPFTMRNRVYSQSAGSNGQSDFTIATTGDGGSFGMPILTVVSVKKNGSVLDSANWSFDDTDTVTIDT
jgi:hypothetical protein